MSKKRIKIMLLIFMIITAGLIVRLFYIQIIGGNSLSREAAAQRMSNIKIENVRGDFVDRNGINLTSRTQKSTAVLKPLILREEPQAIEQICHVLGLDVENTMKEIQNTKDPILFEVDEQSKAILFELNLKGVSFVNSLNRYSTDTKAKHLLGYLNKADQVGSQGLEKLFESTLDYGRDSTIGVVTDARNNMMQGLGYRLVKADVNRNKKLNIQLTIDYHIQTIVENALEQRGLTGAIVVENVENGDIVAMCSKPDFDPNDIERYLMSYKRPLFNRAIAQYNIGSVFKLVDLAALFETTPDYNLEFDCQGYIMVEDTEIRCSSYEKGGHGLINLDYALANSCNAYFINMALELGVNPILMMSSKLGMGQNTGISLQGIEEAKGVIPTLEETRNPGDVANIAIGQGQIMATPLQVADLTATIANGGVKNNINVIDAIMDDAGNKVRDLKNTSGTRVMSESTAAKIRELMEGVINYGTGKKANLDMFGGAGGKTGSAETGQFIEEQKVIQAWFAGYFPAKKPKYSVAIFIEDGKSGGSAAAPIFAEIGAEVMRKGF